MTSVIGSLRALSDEQRLRGLRELVARDREVEADLLVHLAELDARSLHAELGYPSLFAYCTQELHFSEGAAYNRIVVARAARRFPRVLEWLRSGEIHLSGLRALAPHLTCESCDELLALARHRSKKAIEELIADRCPRPDAPAVVRRLPAPRGTSAPGASVPAATRLMTEPTRTATPSPRTVVEPALTEQPLGGERYRIQFTGGAELRQLLQEARGLLRHRIPDGAPGPIFEQALRLLVRELRKSKYAQTSRPLSRRASENRDTGPARQIPAQIRREVVARDGERCTFVGRRGRVCGSRDGLEFHHLDPWARSHRHSADRIALYCRTHNHLAAERDYGRDHMQRCRAGGVGQRPTCPGTGSGTAAP
jgi:hypothetical protein